MRIYILQAKYDFFFFANISTGIRIPLHDEFESLLTCACSTGRVFKSFSAVMVLKVPPSFPLFTLQKSKAVALDKIVRSCVILVKIALEQV